MAEAAATAAPSGRELSTEFMPAPDGTVYGLAVIDENCVVSGDDKGACVVWARAGSTKDFTPVASLLEHEGVVRAITPIPAGTAGFPTGGFATACMDKKIRLYSLDRTSGVATALVNTLTGHFMGVISLGWTVGGQLISGGWDGIVRVWDVSTGSCLHILEGHENGTCVLGLPNGDIAVGSTGRKDEHSRHVDFKIRIWRQQAGSGGYVVSATLTDHEQAVRDLALLPGGAGYVSVGNDGAVKLRNPDGSVRVTFLNPVSEEGKPHSVFRVHVTAAGEVVTGCEDQALRVYAEDGTVTTHLLPGTPWAVASLPDSGDVVAGCGQAGTSKRGHVYIFSARPDRAGDEFARLTYQNDMTPPPKAGAGGAGGGSSGGGGGSKGVKITGPYEAREAFPGSADGQYGFFKRDADGAVMVCAWSAEAATWLDIGEMAGDEAAANDVMEVDGQETGAAEGGKKWDYTCGVTLETKSGMRSLQLRFDEAEDPMDVATRFCAHNAVPLDSAEQIRAFVVERKMERAASSKRTRTIPTYRHFPSPAFIDLYTVDFKKVAPKLLENNAAVAASPDPAVAALALSADEVEVWGKTMSVLEQVTRYHSSKVPRPGVKLLVDKLLRWPPALLLPVVDTLRMLVLHGDGVEAVLDATAGGGDGFVARELERLAACGAAPEQRGVVLTTARVLFNGFRQSRLRDALYANAGRVLAAVGSLLSYEHVTVKSAGAAVLYNYGTLFVQLRRAKVADEVSTIAAGAGSALGGPVPDVSADLVQLAITVAVAGLQHVKEEEPIYRLVVALGTLVVIDPANAAFARANGSEAALAAALAAVPASAAVKEAVTELRSAITSAA